MKDVLLDYLFGKGCLVATEKDPPHAMEVLVSLAKTFDIRITEGHSLACEEMIHVAERNLGLYVPRAFYVGFPETVRNLTRDERLLDQLLHYAQTYGLGDFSKPGHSLFEEDFERAFFNESTEPKNYKIISEKEAEAMLRESADALLESSRPLSQQQYAVLRSYIEEYGYKVKKCACKDTAVELLLDTRDVRYADFLMLADVIRLVEQLQYKVYGSTNIKMLRLANQDRKLIKSVLDSIFGSGESRRVNAADCYEKRQLWNGLLHHIHYKPQTKQAELFLLAMRNGMNLSVYAAFERAMRAGRIRAAVNTLQKGKGSAAVLRNLNYLLSRCTTIEEAEAVLQQAKSDNLIVLIQLLLQYRNYDTTGARTFKFTKFNKLRVHKETAEEMAKRKSILPKSLVAAVSRILRIYLQEACKGKLGKVYADKALKGVALPLEETTSMGGVGVLPKGSRIPIPGGKKIRAFTYWEKVNDIDLSAVGIMENGEQRIFAWDTAYGEAKKGIIHSGDQTSGYDGGSEYFDISIPELKQEYPDMKFLLFTNYVFSGLNFNQCYCKAGFMLRDEEDSGEIFEPKTVKSSYSITCESREADMFAIDLEKREFVWLNMARDNFRNCASCSLHDYLLPYMNVTEVINLYDLATMMATEVVERPEDADVVFSDRDLNIPDTTRQIRPCDIDKVMALLNK